MDSPTCIINGHVFSIISFIIMIRFFFIPSFLIVIPSAVTDKNFPSVTAEGNDEIIFYW
jgi:hypothetical protein